MIFKKLKKELGVFTLTCIGVGSMVGSGVFAIPAAVGAATGPALVLAILIAGIIATFFALCYAELGSAFPLEGGPYAHPRLAMGDLIGFLMGWGFFLYLFFGTAAVIDIFVVYLGFYIPGLAVSGVLTSAGTTIAVIVLWIFTIINIVGVKWGGLFSAITTVGKLIPLLLFGIIGLCFLKTGDFTPFMPYGYKGLTLGISLFFWSFTGFEAIVVPTEEVRKPSKTIPLAIIATMIVSTIVYVVIGYGFVGLINFDGINLSNWSDATKLSSPLADVSKGAGLYFLATVVTIGAIISTAGTGGTRVLTQGRIPYVMARNHLFWSLMNKTNKKYSTPMFSLIFAAILTTITLIAVPSFPSVALISSIVSVLPYAAAVLATAILRTTHKSEKRPFKLPYVIPFTLIGFILATFVFYWARWPWTFLGTLLMFLGFFVFLFVKSRNFSWRKSLWLPVYLIGISIISYFGEHTQDISVPDGFPKAMDVLKMPYDLIVLAIWGSIIFFWAYRENIKS
jgi:amino acid transporter